MLFQKYEHLQRQQQSHFPKIRTKASEIKATATTSETPTQKNTTTTFDTTTVGRTLY